MNTPAINSPTNTTGNIDPLYYSDSGLSTSSFDDNINHEAAVIAPPAVVGEEVTTQQTKPPLPASGQSRRGGALTKMPPSVGTESPNRRGDKRKRKVSKGDHKAPKRVKTAERRKKCRFIESEASESEGSVPKQAKTASGDNEDDSSTSSDDQYDSSFVVSDNSSSDDSGVITPLHVRFTHEEMDAFEQRLLTHSAVDSRAEKELKHNTVKEVESAIMALENNDDNNADTESEQESTAM